MTEYYDPDIKPRPERRISQSSRYDDSIVIIFPYDAKVVERVRLVPNRRWDSLNKEWRAPKASLKEAARILGFAVNIKLKPLMEGEEKAPEPPKPAAIVEPPKDAPQPLGIEVSLFPYQRAGVAFFQDKESGILADEMGLGKTLQGIAWASTRRPALVICPASLKSNWQREILRARPQDKIQVLGSKDGLQPEQDWLIINYDILDKFLDRLKEYGVKTALLDEAHYIKNYKAKRTKLVTDMLECCVKNKLLLTGTPILNRPIELWPLLVAVGKENPKSFMWWAKRFADAKKERFGWNFSGAANLDELKTRIAPYFLRRRKAEVLTDLPDKIQQHTTVELDNKHAYQDASEDVIAFLRDTAGNEAAYRAARAEILVRLNILRRLSAEGKLTACKDQLDAHVDAGSQVIVMSSFKEPLARLHEQYPDISVLFTGDLSTDERSKAVDAFTSGKKLIFLGTVGAAGVGLNLQVASNMIFLDFPWTPAAKSQAEDRIHRIGQKNAALITNLVGEGTIDSYMVSILAAKLSVINQIVSGEQQAAVAGHDMLDDLVASLLGRPIKHESHEPAAEPAIPVIAATNAPVSTLTWHEAKPLQERMGLTGGHGSLGLLTTAGGYGGGDTSEMRPGAIPTHMRLFEPGATPTRCRVIHQHDDGDQTLRCKEGTFVKTTDGKIFKQVREPNVRDPLLAAVVSKACGLGLCVAEPKGKKSPKINMFGVENDTDKYIVAVDGFFGQFDTKEQAEKVYNAVGGYDGDDGLAGTGFSSSQMMAPHYKPKYIGGWVPPGGIDLISLHQPIDIADYIKKHPKRILAKFTPDARTAAQRLADKKFAKNWFGEGFFGDMK